MVCDIDHMLARAGRYSGWRPLSASPQSGYLLDTTPKGKPAHFHPVLLLSAPPRRTVPEMPSYDRHHLTLMRCSSAGTDRQGGLPSSR